MNNLKDFYKQYRGTSGEWETDINFLLQEVDNMLNHKFHSLDIVTQVGLFLDKEEKQLQEYIKNLVIHYTYKRVFNKANKYYQSKKKLYIEDEITFKNDFQHFIKKTFDLNDYSHIKKFSNNLLNAILSNECIVNKDVVNGRPIDSENKAMRKFALKQNRDNCYLCGVQTNNTKEKTKINFYDWHLQKQSNFTDTFLIGYKDILQEHNQHLTNKIVENIYKNKTIKDDFIYHFSTRFKKSYNFILKLFSEKKDKTNQITNNFHKLNQHTIEKLSRNIVLNDFNKEFKFAYAFHNNKLMKIEHCIAVDWGGGKSEENLLISCHKCNQKKSNTTFFTEFSINKFFINEFEPEKAKKAFTGTLGDEALISLKIKQNFQCSDCSKKFSDPGIFYLRRINDEDGYHYLNTLITCQHCLRRGNKLSSNTFLDEFIKIKD